MLKNSWIYSGGIIVFAGILFVINSCNKENNDKTSLKNTPPHAAFTISPYTGDTETIFHFDASSSSDPEDAGFDLMVRWDWENDSTWDTDWLYEKEMDHTFSHEGRKNVSLEVKDKQEYTGDVVNKLIVINNEGGTGEPCPGIPSFQYQGRWYNTTLIGSQCWMKENLNFETPGSYCYDDDTNNCTLYGRLYRWETIMNGESSSNKVPSGVRGICPEGWHIPGDEEWKILEGKVDSIYSIGDTIWDRWGGRGYDAGQRLKSVSGWASNGGGTDVYNFSALPGGYRLTDSYTSLKGSGEWWSSTSSADQYHESAWCRRLYYGTDYISRIYRLNEYGLSVRCLKD